MRIFILLLLVCLFVPVTAKAQNHHVYCDMAESTAAIQSCLKKHLDSAQKRLNKIYDALSMTLESEGKRQELGALQQSWLAYRDAECAWELGRTETPALKRINKLSCLARVTDDRADLLNVATDGDGETGPRQYGSFPRWMNVLAKDYPDIYWNYGSRAAYDLNCDNEAEQVMSGVFFKKQSVKSYDEESVQTEEKTQQSAPLTDFSQEIIFSIVENPVTGRPRAKLFRFAVKEMDMPKAICSGPVYFNMKTEKLSEQPEACASYLEIKHGNCQPKKIKWDKKNFILKE